MNRIYKLVRQLSELEKKTAPRIFRIEIVLDNEVEVIEVDQVTKQNRTYTRPLNEEEKAHQRWEVEQLAKYGWIDSSKDPFPERNSYESE